MATNKIELSVGAKKQVSKPSTGMGVKSAADTGKQALSVGKQSVKTQTLMLQETKKLVKSLTSVDKSINDLKTSIEKNVLPKSKDNIQYKGRSGIDLGSSGKIKTAIDQPNKYLEAENQSSKLQKINIHETKKLTRSLVSVDKSISMLKAAIEKNTNAAQTANPPAGGGAGTGGGAGGIGQMGASVPFIGAAIAGFGYLAKKVMDLGKASREALMEQKGTAGISGAVDYNVGIFDPTEVAQYRKTRRMQSGRLQSEAVIKEDSRAYRYAERFGDISSVAQVQGLMDRMAQGAGGPGGTQGIEDILRITAKEGGIQTELPLMMRMMEDVMETAVSNGVKDAKLSESFAKEVASYTAADPSRSLKSIQKSIEQRRAISDAISKGSFGQSALTARTTALSMEMIGADAGLRKKIGGQLGISQERLESGELSHSERMAMVGLMNEGAGGVDIGEQMQKKIAEEAGSAARYIALNQQVYQTGLTTSNLLANWSKFTGQKTGGPAQEDILETGVTGDIRDQARLMAEQKATRISHPGAKAARDVLYATEQSMLKLANESAPLVQSGLEGLDEVSKLSAKSINKLTNELKELYGLISGDKNNKKSLKSYFMQFITD